MRWIDEHRIIAILGTIFIVLVMLLAFSFTRAGESTIIGRSIQGIFSTVDGGANSASEAVKEAPVTKKELQKRIAELEEQNSKLEQQLLDEQMSQQQLKELQQLSAAFDYKTANRSNTIAADITSFDKSVWTTTFMINVGANDGVEINDVVVDGTGLVGRVMSVNNNSSKVISIIDDNSTVSFKVTRDSSIEGILDGMVKGKLSGYVLNSKSGIIKGDTLVTTGKGLFPSGIKVGTVTAVKYNSDTQLKEVTVRAAVDFRSLKKVAVIK